MGIQTVVIVKMYRYVRIVIMYIVDYSLSFCFCLFVKSCTCVNKNIIQIMDG
jgi:hypothetical protein